MARVAPEWLRLAASLCNECVYASVSDADQAYYYRTRKLNEMTRDKRTKLRSVVLAGQACGDAAMFT